MKYSQKALDISASPTLAIDALAKKLRESGENVIGFGAGEPDFDTPENIKYAAICAIVRGYTKYTPVAGILCLKEAVVKYYKQNYNLEYSPDEVVISNGAKHSLMNVFFSLLNEGDEVLLPTPYWVTYPELIKLAGGKVVAVPTTKEANYKISSKVLQKYLTSKTKALVLNSPSNPTGMVYTYEELKDIVEFCIQNDIFIISDEIYDKLIYDDQKHISAASFGEKAKELTIIVNGVSKSYAMTGWRIGYTLSNRDLAKIMTNLQSHTTSNPNSIAQYAAYEALSGSQESLKKMVEEFAKRRDLIYELVNDIEGLSSIKPQGAFYIWVDLSGIIGKSFEGKIIDSANTFAKLLLESEKVAVVPSEGFGMENHIRLSYATSENNIKEGLARIKRFVEKLK
ncbi:pyridoxal phosphate-dependent aminotransferase [Caldicellulosiruptor morganii]|uniref:Aminotransferase n=1 Tax=Caldicellulosiruptor morganii TaxID=1387555 RepID=A0ABY7BLD9_9FIRM|nr:pyridoxal phosphate-dependent aminotransferase [Caldicellulosiruptor morganii]WAM33112.1 pyridoxal phosphate-dependent aminotransferase [Caldicellulosiruptor morganii]